MMMEKFALRSRVLLAGAAMSALLLAGAPAFAVTPADTLVEGFAIDDIISMDPGEAFELSTAEVTGNTYDLLVRLDLSDTSKVKGDLAESWTVSDDGLTYTFKLKPGLKFASGNPITAADVAYSFERAIKLDKSPAFIIGQFGINGDNVTEKAKAVDDTTFQFTVDKAYAPSFVLNCLSATVASVVDAKLVKEHVAAVTPSADYKYDNDFGNAWLKTGYAGSGAFKLREWRANEVVVMERNDNYYGEKAKLARVIYRNMKESSGQRLALEAGDIDVARNLEPNDLDAIAKNADLTTTSAPKGTVYYISLNQKNPNLAKPEVRQAFKYLVDYDAIELDHPQGHRRDPPDLPAEGRARRARRESLQVRRRQGQGTAGQGRPGRRLQRHHGRAQHPADDRHGGIDPADARPGRHQAGDHPRRRQADADQIPRPQPRHLYRPVGPGLFRSELQCPDLRQQPRQFGRRQDQDAGLAQCLGHSGTDQADRGGPAREGCGQARRRCTRICRRRCSKPARSSSSTSRLEVAGLRKNLKGFKLGPSFDTNFVGSGLQGVMPADAPHERC